MNALTTSNYYCCSRSLYINPKYCLVPPRKGKTKQIFTASLSERRTEGDVDDSPASPSTRTQLDFLEQLTTTSPSGSSPIAIGDECENSGVACYASDGNNEELTIREKLTLLVGDRDDDFTLRLGKKLKVPKLLTVSQKRNIKRQAYLNEVSRRNDSTFFATIGAFVLLPPIIILAVAIATGYVQLFP